MSLFPTISPPRISTFSEINLGLSALFSLQMSSIFKEKLSLEPTSLSTYCPITLFPLEPNCTLFSHISLTAHSLHHAARPSGTFSEVTNDLLKSVQLTFFSSLTSQDIIWLSSSWNSLFLWLPHELSTFWLRLRCHDISCFSDGSFQLLLWWSLHLPISEDCTPHGTVSSLLCLGLSTPFNWSQMNGVQILTLSLSNHVAKLFHPLVFSISSVKWGVQ